MSIFDRIRRYPELKAAIINMKSGTVFKAVIWRREGPWMVLRSAEILQDRGNTAKQAVDGEVCVMMADIDFIQVP